jgi:hypothetical protein
MATINVTLGQIEIAGLNPSVVIGEISLPSPERTYVIPHENRTYVIPHENRTYIVRR